MKIGIVVGSCRKGSFSKSIGNYIKDLGNGEFAFEDVEIGNLPMFNQDYDDEGKTPKEWETFRKHIKELDGFIFITPEYNRGLPPVLKNALDVGSRPYGQNAWDGKSAGVISQSMGALAGFGAHHQLRQSLVFLNLKTLAQPEMYLGEMNEKVDASGVLMCTRTKEFIQSFVRTFEDWTKTNHK